MVQDQEETIKVWKRREYLERKHDEITGRMIHTNPINKKRLAYNELEEYMMEGCE